MRRCVSRAVRGSADELGDYWNRYVNSGENRVIKRDVDQFLKKWVKKGSFLDELDFHSELFFQKKKRIVLDLSVDVDVYFDYVFHFITYFELIDISDSGLDFFVSGILDLSDGKKTKRGVGYVKFAVDDGISYDEFENSLTVFFSDLFIRSFVANNDMFSLTELEFFNEYTDGPED